MKPPFDLKDIKPGAFSYFTKRKLKNKDGEERGEIFLWKPKNSTVCCYALECPFCGEEQQGEILLARRPYRVKCSKCDKSISLPKLSAQAKREAKKEMKG